MGQGCEGQRNFSGLSIGENMKQMNKLGNSGIEVSKICLGTMMFGDQTAAAEAANIVSAALDHSVNFIDTADVYTRGASEKMLAPLLKNQRHRFVLASKLGNKMSDLPNEAGYSRTWMMRAIEGSLQRLETDYLDVYYLHRDNPGLDLEEPIRAMGDLLQQGKIRSWGVSNFRGWRIAQVVEMARRMNVPQPVVCQPYYNLSNRMPEVEILPACKAYGLAVVPYSPIARGVLTGKYKAGVAPPADSRAGRKDSRILETEFREESLLVAEQLKIRAGELGVSLLHYACAWVLRNKIVTSVIAGPRTLAQWLDYFACLNVELTEEDDKLVDSLVRPGHPSTPGYTDPSYPFSGRII
jgi:aryl-alcohol dehydrogenase-like predicted oxidoreductase